MNKSERHEFVERYKSERVERVDIKAKKTDRFGKEDQMNLPRHKTSCTWFEECPIDYKCRAFDSSKLRCVNCNLHQEEGICHKKELHTPKVFNMMITRERIDLDGKEE